MFKITQQRSDRLKPQSHNSDPVPGRTKQWMLSRALSELGFGPESLSKKKNGVLGGNVVRNQGPIWWE